MTAIELLQNKKIEAVKRQDSYRGEIRLTLVEVGQILSELEKPEPTSDAVKILCKRYGTSLAKIAMDLEAENERLKDILRIGCHCNREELIRWLERNKITSDRPYEKDNTIVLRMMVIIQALKEKTND